MIPYKMFHNQEKEFKAQVLKDIGSIWLSLVSNLSREKSIIKREKNLLKEKRSIG